jgi:hypothetical protein
MVGNTMQVDGHDDHIVHASNKGAREMQNQWLLPMCVTHILTTDWQVWCTYIKCIYNVCVLLNISHNTIEKIDLNLHVVIHNGVNTVALVCNAILCHIGNNIFRLPIQCRFDYICLFLSLFQATLAREELMTPSWDSWRPLSTNQGELHNEAHRGFDRCTPAPL